MTVGSALVSALVPLPTPNMPSFAGSGGNLAQPSPTYSLQGQGNYARLAQPIPVVYGRHLVYPDLAATARKSVVSGKSVSVRVDLGVRRIIKKKHTTYLRTTLTTHTYQ